MPHWISVSGKCPRSVNTRGEDGFAATSWRARTLIADLIEKRTRKFGRAIFRAAPRQIRNGPKIK